jgi:hypothetical protein
MAAWQTMARNTGAIDFIVIDSDHWRPEINRVARLTYIRGINVTTGQIMTT